MDPQALWQATLEELKETLSKANFSMWFRDTFIAEDNGDSIVIGVPSTFYLDWIRGKYHKNIAETLRKLRPTIREITYKTATKTTPAPIELSDEPYEAPRPTPKKEIPTHGPQYGDPVILPIGDLTPAVAATALAQQQQHQQDETPVNHTPLDPNRVFTNFVVGNSNRLAHAVSLAAAQEPGQKYNPLFLYGGVGLGKTHLAHAIGNEIKKHNPAVKIIYVSCEVFTNEFIESLRQNNIDSFKKRYRHADVLLIDDIQFMSGKGRTQEEFFHTFNALHQAKKQIVLTADQEPQNIPGLEDRLTSRFAWGMVADIQAPDFETRIAILREKCIEKGYDLSADVIEMIAQTVQSNIRELEGALQRVLTHAEITRQPLTPEFVAQVFSAVAPAVRGRSMNATKVIDIVSKYFELKPEEVMGKRRYKELVYPRQLVMYLLRHELSFSYPNIGKALGGKDHTTIMHGVDKIEKELARNSNIQYDLSQLKEKLHQSS
jgi:chromosomal replication initiator protein